MLGHEVLVEGVVSAAIGSLVIAGCAAAISTAAPAVDEAATITELTVVALEQSGNPPTGRTYNQDNGGPYAVAAVACLGGR